MRDHDCVTFLAASRILACSLATTYRWGQEGKFGPLVRNCYPRRIRLDAIRALAGPLTQTQIELTSRARPSRKRQARHG